VRNLTSVFCSSSFCCSIWVASSSAVCDSDGLEWKDLGGELLRGLRQPTTAMNSSGRGGELGLFARAGWLRDAGWRRKAG
jgi:hypothetical protein